MFVDESKTRDMEDKKIALPDTDDQITITTTGSPLKRHIVRGEAIQDVSKYPKAALGPNSWNADGAVKGAKAIRCTKPSKKVIMALLALCTLCSGMPAIHSCKSSLVDS
jgi:hypothetical protein